MKPDTNVRYTRNSKFAQNTAINMHKFTYLFVRFSFFFHRNSSTKEVIANYRRVWTFFVRKDRGDTTNMVEML